MGCIFSYAQAFKKKYAFFILESSCISLLRKSLFLSRLCWCFALCTFLCFHIIFMHLCVFAWVPQNQRLSGFLCHGLLKERSQEKESRGVQWGREWNWARLWPPADPRRLWSMSYTTELVPPVVRESVSHSPLCGGGAGRVCCNLQMRRI